MTRSASTDPHRDPWPYDGPIASASGRRPFNGYLWPTEVWVAYHEGPPLKHLSYDWRIGIIHLADGRWSTGGFVHEIEPDRTIFGHRCCFPTRAAAIRAQAGRLIWRARGAVRRGEMKSPVAAGLVAWALDLVATEAGGQRRVPANLERLAPAPPLVILPPGQIDLFGAAA